MKIYVTSEISMGMKIQVTLFWIVILHSDVVVQKYFREPYCLHLQGEEDEDSKVHCTKQAAPARQSACDMYMEHVDGTTRANKFITILQIVIQVQISFSAHQNWIRPQLCRWLIS
jgi:hypothetical protein